MTISRDEKPFEQEANNHDHDREPDDQEESVVSSDSAIIVEFPVRTLHHFDVSLQPVRLSGRIGEIDPLLTKTHRLFNASDSLPAETKTDVFVWIKDFALLLIQTIEVDTTAPQTEQKHCATEDNQSDRQHVDKPAQTMFLLLLTQGLQ